MRDSLLFRNKTQCVTHVLNYRSLTTTMFKDYSTVPEILEARRNNSRGWKRDHNRSSYITKAKKATDYREIMPKNGSLVIGNFGGW